MLSLLKQMCIKAFHACNYTQIYHQLFITDTPVTLYAYQQQKWLYLTAGHM